MLRYLRSWKENKASFVTRIRVLPPLQVGSRLLLQLAPSLWGCRVLRLVKKAREPSEAGRQGPKKHVWIAAMRPCIRPSQQGKADHVCLEPGGSQRHRKRRNAIWEEDVGQRPDRWSGTEMATDLKAENSDSEEVLCPVEKFWKLTPRLFHIQVVLMRLWLPDLRYQNFERGHLFRVGKVLINSKVLF